MVEELRKERERSGRGRSISRQCSRSIGKTQGEIVAWIVVKCLVPEIEPRPADRRCDTLTADLYKETGSSNLL